jgi:heat shock protein HslJ
MRPVLAVPLLLLLAGCSSDLDLDGKAFTSTSVEGHDLVEGTSIQLTFEDGSMSANAGCNTTSGSYEIDDGTLRWAGPAASTLIGCPEDQAAQDDWLTQLLTDGVEAEQDGDTLTLTDDDVEIVLEA